MTKNEKKFISEDLAYELRMLLGAREVVKTADKNEFGNISSLFRDSIYLHTRNLYNFFYGCARNDASVYDFTNYVFDVSLYIKWKKALHSYVLHIDKSRTNSGNIIDDKQLSYIAVEFADDIEKLWRVWISVTNDKDLKNILNECLNEAIIESNDDRTKLLKILYKHE